MSYMVLRKITVITVLSFLIISCGTSALTHASHSISTSSISSLGVLASVSVDMWVWDGSSWVTSIEKPVGTELEFKIRVVTTGPFAGDLIVIVELPTFLFYSDWADPPPKEAQDHAMSWEWEGTIGSAEIFIYYNAEIEQTGSDNVYVEASIWKPWPPKFGEGSVQVTGTPPPTLSYSPTSHDFGDMYEGETDSTTFEIWNSGTGTLTYTLSESCGWVDVTPTSGDSTGEHDTITVSIDTTGLSEDTHSCSISISSNGGSGDFTVEVNVEVNIVSVDIELCTGWNLITVPFDNGMMASDLADNITGSIMVSRFDAINQTYKTYICGGPPGFDFLIVDGYGYFVLVDQNSTLSMSGYRIESVSVSLSVDWNMIGWYHTYNTTASSLGDNITGCIMVSWFDSVSQTFKTYIVGGPPGFDFTITPGMGLFALVDTASTWHGEG